MAAITSNGTGGGNWSAGASWTGAAVPAEGDTVTIQNGDTIIIDQTITVGADTTTAAIDIASGGKLELLHTAAADYILTCKGDLKISSGGTFEIGTVANPIPSTRKFTIKLNYSATLSVDEFGLLNHGDMIIQGASKTPHTLLTSDLSVAGTVWTVGNTTGWEVGDKVAIASTSTSYFGHEQQEIQTVDSATQVTMTLGASTSHSGTSPTQAEVINLTRNAKITSYDNAYCGYIENFTGSLVDIDYVEFYKMNRILTLSSVIKYSSFWGYGSSVYFLDIKGSSIIDNCVSYRVKRYHIYMNSAENEITNNIMIGSIDADGIGIYVYNTDNTITGNSVSSIKEAGYYLNETGGTRALIFNDNVAHSIYVSGFKFTVKKGFNPTFSNLTAWYAGTNMGGFNLDGSTLLTIKDSNMQNCIGRLNNSNTIIFDNFTVTGNYAIKTGNNSINNIKFVDSALYSLHLSHTNYYRTFTLINTLLPAGVLCMATNTKGSYVQCEDLGQVQYADKAWYTNGIVVRDSSTYKHGSYATRFDYQANNSAWLEYDTYIPVKNGEQIVISAWLRKNASYTDANRPKITISGQGITEDSDQMSNVTDTWERVTVSGAPTRTGLAKLTISTYLVNASASAWVDFEKTDVLTGVLNTIEGDYWANGHIAEVFMDTGSITAAEFWKTLLTDVDKTGSFANLIEDYLDAAISGRAPANEYDTEMAYIPSNLGDVPTAAELIAVHGSGAWTSADVSALAIEANIESHVTNSLNTYDPPKRSEATSDKNEILTDHTTMKQTTTGTYDRDTDSLEAIRDNQASISSIATAVWSKQLSDLTVAGSIGNYIKSKLLSVAKFLALK